MKNRSIIFVIGLVVITMGIWITFGTKENETTKINKTEIIEKQKDIKSEDKIAQVEQMAKKQKIAQQKESEAFEKKGWKKVDVPEPDIDVISLNPDALKDKEEEIQIQLQTNGYKGEKLNKIKEIFLSSTNFKTKFVALESLGRSKDRNAQKILVDLFSETDDSKLQKGIIKFVRPQNLEDESAQFLFSIMADNVLSNEYKEMATFNILSMELATKKTVSDEIYKKVSPDWLPNFRKILETRF